MQGWDGSDTSSINTPPMQSLARMNNKIKLGNAEIEQQPGGKTVHVPIQNVEQDKKQAGVAQPNMQKDTLYNLFLSHLLRPREWTA